MSAKANQILLPLSVLIFATALIFAAIRFSQTRTTKKPLAGGIEYIRQQAIYDAQKTGAQSYEFNWGGVLPPLGM